MFGYHNPFHVHGTNTNWKDPKHKNQINAEDKTLLEWQWEAFNRIWAAQFALISAFCGSGKSFLQVALAICDVVESNYKQKQLIIVPQKHISDGFKDHSILDKEGQKYQWKVGNNFCEFGSKDVINRLINWLLAPIVRVPDPLVITGVNAIACHQSLVLAWNQMSSSEQQIAVKNLTLRIDEAHHIKGVYDQDNDGYTDAEKVVLDQSATQLGSICQYMVSNGDPTSKLCLTTATFYRGDQGLILSDMVKSRFSTYYLPWVRHWETLGIESFDIQYQEYDSLINLIQTVVQAIQSEPDERHLIVIPSTGQKWRRNGPEYLSLITELNKFIPVGEILDLVPRNTQGQRKELLLKEPKEFSKHNPSKFRVIITCMIGREGTDWCPCSRVYHMAPESSITLAVQTLGRAFRRFDEKQNVKIKYYVQKFLTPGPNMSKRDLLSDRTNALLVCIQMDDMCHPIMIPVIEASGQSNGTPTTSGTTKVGLSGLLGLDWTKIVGDVLIEVGLIQSCTKENIQAAIASVLKSYILPIIVNVDDIRDALMAIVVRRFVPQGHLSNLIDVKFVRERGFDKVMEDYVNGRTLYLGDFSTADWDALRNILHDDWEERFADYCAHRKEGGPR